MHYENINTTIAAIATSLTPAGIGIIRISGDEAFKIASKIFVDKNKNPININESHKIKYGFIYDKNKNEFIDEVILLPMKAPHSYTAEDVIEIQSHGSIIVLKRILDLVVENGTRLAEPGEFTKRAFLNGRIDLSKAESVADLISSKNEYARKASLNELKGGMSNKINEYRKIILEDVAFIEAALDDPEHIEIADFKDDKLKNHIYNIKNELNHMIENYDNGRVIKEGINTCIIGKPNVGKSSLLNVLLNEERAIVTDIAGTTRDVIKESINLGGITLNIIDTAGIRENKNGNEDLDKVESIGIEKAKAEAKNADLILYVLDATKEIDDEDKKLIEELKNKKIIFILNKSDLLDSTCSGELKFCRGELASPLSTPVGADIIRPLQSANPSIYNFRRGELSEGAPSGVTSPFIYFSALTRSGLAELIDTITKMFINNEIDFNTEIFISNERKLNLIKDSVNSLSNVEEGINSGISEDFLTIDLNDAYVSLSKVLGEEIDDDLANEIFSKFCMGK